MKTIIKTLVFALVFVFSYTAHAQKFPDLDKSPMDAATYPSNYKVSDKVIKITYSRPQLNGRDISKLVPNDDVWRTGANEAAEITFYKDVLFGDKKVKAGTYSLFTIPGEKEWTIILSSDINVWGAYTYKQDQDVARIKAPTSQGKDILDAFSIVFEESATGTDMNIGWGKLRVKIPFTF